MLQAEFFYNDCKRIILENLEFAKSIVNTSDDSFRDDVTKLTNEMSKQRLELGEKIIHLKTKQSHVIDNVSKARDTCNTLNEYEAKVKQLTEEEDKKLKNVQLMTEFQEFKKEIIGNFSDTHGSEVTGNGHENIVDIVETGGNVCSMFDPWSKILMSNPVRNIKCGHHYDRDSVTAMIWHNASVRCPVAGCASRIYIQRDHLVDDLGLLEQIKAHKAEQDAQGSESEDEN